ncbi:MAG: hypothetical protein K1X94_31770 [Sandaracinaceae bacterium]|nr:hypothetical protein [Sandaracinaceae bacterium]
MGVPLDLALLLQVVGSPGLRLAAILGVVVLVAAIVAFVSWRARKQRQAREAPLVEVERLGPRSIAPPPQQVTRELHPGSDRRSVHPAGGVAETAVRDGRAPSVRPVAAPAPVRASERPPQMLHHEPPARAHSVHPPRPISLDELPPPRDSLE